MLTNVVLVIPTLAVLIIVAVAWSFIGQVDQVVTAPGKVIPHDKIKIIQHLEGGIVKQVVARAFDDKTLLITCGTYDQAIRIVPPLVVNEEQIRDFLEIYRRAVASVG